MADGAEREEIEEPAEDTTRRQIALTAIAVAVALMAIAVVAAALAVHKPQREHEHDRRPAQMATLTRRRRIYAEHEAQDDRAHR